VSPQQFFFRARAEKGIARHIDASSIVWTLIDNSKLANQIARLAAIVVKIHFVLYSLTLPDKNNIFLTNNYQTSDIVHVVAF